MEKWKFIQKTTGKKAVEYWISDQGRLKCVYSKSDKFIIKLGSKHKLGYRHTAIGWIHRLVAKAFVPNP